MFPDRIKRESLTDEQRLLDSLAEEFTRRARDGEQPQISEYVDRYPDLSDRIKELFPLLGFLNKVAEEVADEYASGVSIDADSASSQIEVDSSAIASDNTLEIKGETSIQAGIQLGDYHLVRQIGRGGMGVVYEGRHVSLGSTVAVKVLTATSDRMKLRERFLREASAAARMRHPNIVRVHDFGSSGTSLYYVMPLIDGYALDQIVDATRKDESSKSANRSSAIRAQEGVTNVNVDSTIALNRKLESGTGAGEVEMEGERLEGQSVDDAAPTERELRILQIIDKRAAFRWDWIATIGADAADAIAYAHEQGVVHRDIKPANLIVDLKGKVFVTDFGLAKAVDDQSLTATGDVLGTLRYMPPEAFRGQADWRGDIYSLGLTLYELGANRPALEGTDRAKLVQDITDGNVLRLQKIERNVPRDLSTIIHKAIEADPFARYQSGEEFRDDLRRFLAGQPVSARPASLTYRTSRWIGRHKIISALAASLFLLLTIAAIASTISSSRYKDLATEKESQRVAAVDAKRRSEKAEVAAEGMLVKSLVSDAEGWSLRNEQGRREKGLESLQQAISLSRVLGSFKDYQLQFNEIAATLFSMDDAVPVSKWEHPQDLGLIESIAFSGDLSAYTWYHQANAQSFKMFQRESEDSNFRLMTKFPAGPFALNDLRVSHDNRYAVATSDELDLLIYDIERQQRITSDVRPADGRAFEFVPDEDRVLVITSDNNLVAVSLADGSITRAYVDFPANRIFNEIKISPDGGTVALYRAFEHYLLTYELETDKWNEIPADGRQFVTACWSPDGNQLATAGDTVWVWDVALRRQVFEIERTHSSTRKLAWAAGGKLLLSSGGDGQTRCYRVASGNEVLRLDSQLVRVSHDGSNIVLRSGANFEQLRLDENDVLHQFAIGSGAQLSAAIVGDRQLWFGDGWELYLADLISDRIEFVKQYPSASIAIDPKHRDLFLHQGEDGYHRYPIIERELEGAKVFENESTLKIGPPQRLSVFCKETATEWDSERLYRIRYDSEGEKLSLARANGAETCVAILSREGWNGIHLHPRLPSDGCIPNPKLPQLATRAFYSLGIDVVNSETGKMLFTNDHSPSTTHFTPDGTRLLLSRDGIIAAFDTTTWNELGSSDPSFSLGDGSPFSIAPDGTLIAAESRNRRGVLFLDSVSFEPLLKIRGRNDDADSFVLENGFDASGKWLITKRGSRSVAAWNLSALRTHFKSIDLPWPLRELGEPPLEISNRVIICDWEPSDVNIEAEVRSHTNAGCAFDPATKSQK